MYWNSVSCYISKRSQDEWLCDKLIPIIVSAKKMGVISRWFFIRYTDTHTFGNPESGLSGTGHHIRFRWQGDASFESIIHVITPGEFRVTSYEPETERYGGPLSLDCCETLFSENSEAVAIWLAGNTLDITSNNQVKISRGVFTASLISAYLSLLPNIEEQRYLLKNTSAWLREQLHIKETPFVQRIRIDDLRDITEAVFPLMGHLEGIRRVQKKITCTRTVISSLCHMACNRMGMGWHEEWVLYSRLE